MLRLPLEFSSNKRHPHVKFEFQYNNGIDFEIKDLLHTGAILCLPENIMFLGMVVGTFSKNDFWIRVIALYNIFINMWQCFSSDTTHA